MGIFWTYFKKTLNFLPLQKPGAIASIADGGAECLDTCREAVLWLRDQFFPDRCDDDNVDRFAATRGITKYDFESDEQYGERIQNAYAWHILGGRKAGVLWALGNSSDAAEFDLECLREEDADRWAEHRIVIKNISGDLLIYLPDMEDAFNDVKQASAKLAEFWLEFGDVAAVTQYRGATAPLTAEYTTVYPFGVGSFELPVLTRYSGMTVMSGEDAIIYPMED